MNNPPILISALDISGDEYAGWLIESLRKQNCQLPVIGLGGHQAKKAGMHLVAEANNHATMSLSKIMSKILFYRKLQHKIITSLDQLQPCAVVLIDSGAFNLKLAKAAYQRHIPVLYLIPPKVWAWGQWRLKKIQKYCTELACLHEFETEFFKAKQCYAQTIQHPRYIRLKPSKTYTKELFAICPGSRDNEIKHCLPNILAACQLILQEIPQAKFNLMVADPGLHPMINKICQDYSDLPITCIHKEQKAAISQANVVIATSGTLTFELALMKIPMIVVYRMGALNYFLASNLVKLNWCSLPNLICQQSVVPELIQQQASPARIAKMALGLAQNKQKRNYMIRQLNVIRQHTLNPKHKTMGEILHEFVDKIT